MARLYEIGNEYASKEDVKFKIINITSMTRCDIMFYDEFNTEINTTKNSIKTGVKYPYHPSVAGIGFYGIGEYKAKIDGKHTLAYQTWRDMIRRCYTEAQILRRPTYRNVTVCKEWLNFQTFAKWFYDNYPKNTKDSELVYNLDKDLLQQNVEYKIYSSTTCCFLPHNVNKFLSSNRGNKVDIGVQWHVPNKKWVVYISEFLNVENKCIYVGGFYDKDEAIKSYIEARKQQAENVKQYMRDLGHWSEDIIQLIK